MPDKIKYLIALSQLKGVGFRRSHQIIQQYGSSENFIEICLKNPGSLPLTIRENCSPGNVQDVLAYAEDQIRFCDRNRVQIIAFSDKAYPYRLKRYDDSPLILYYRGEYDLNSMRTVGIVGTRKMTPYGQWMLDELVRELKPYEEVTISWLAYGIDTQVHRSSVENQVPTIGVMGTGIDQIYPSANRELAARMTRCGGVLTEYGIRTKADAYHFPARNRIIAAMSDALVVVESKEKGGAMITADLAFGYGKDVFAYPGKSMDTYSRGTNLLIKTQKAQLIENARDMIEAMNWSIIDPSKSIQPTLFDQLSEEEQLIMTTFAKNTPFHIDQALLSLPFSSAQVAALLLHLELKGMVKTLPGSRYLIV